MTHLENVYRLCCELKFELQKSVDEGIPYSNQSKVNGQLDLTSRWALVNFIDERIILESIQELKDKP